EERIGARRKLLQSHQTFAVADGVVLPSEESLHQVALRDTLPLRIDNLPNGSCEHNVSDRDGLRIGVHRHPSALGRIKGEGQVANQHLSILEWRDGRFVPAKVA